MGEGVIELIVGCMFSGKTTRLIERVQACRREGLRVIALKSSVDDRYCQTDIVSHNQESLEAHTIDAPGQILEYLPEADVVVVDEVHFFGDDLVDVCRRVVQQGKRVICVGLDRDMWGDVFDHMARLAELAETTVMTTRCAKCGGVGNRTHRKIPLVDNNLVGGAEAFEPRCESCFRPPNSPKPAQSVVGLAQQKQ